MYECERVVCDKIACHRPDPAQRHKRHACHAKRRSMQAPRLPHNEGRRRQVPRLPRKVPRRHRRLTGTKRATRSSVPRLSHKTKIDVTKCHACHAKRRWMSPSATPATRSAAASPATNGPQACHCHIQLI